MPSDTENKEPADVTPQKKVNKGGSTGQSSGSEGTPIQTNVSGEGAMPPAPPMTPDQQKKTASANPGNLASPNTANQQNITNSNSAGNATEGGN